ncbi:methylated-DNA--[protein]-cysteine S-methyltransferase [Fulvivirga sp. RKSG066]|uniref:bifunctional transcriptional activator/DNA repair enzyme AdaA n=1 Tax=Fulvivirga aurantia TaxID=2529383 RepID=UPI0012BBD9FA|nr:methylated-DNA--[protein]-cysteine S-methyltransferase [Fulvivirga aurantia]MTI22114.1 methylated-DNA--[protein]-cysteine S-methyltransferase [Fulvivirga aurantia]
MLTFEEKYNAIVNKDVSYEGVFITGVKTTNIFCRPICTARKPKPENVRFFESVQEAMQHGFRPCKVCKPLEPLEATPKAYEQIIKELTQKPYLRLKDQDLRVRGIDPATIRRWFKKHHNITFHAFQRMLRLNNAYRQISNGEKVTATAYDSGFESLSGFGESYQSIFGSSPTQSTGTGVIVITRFTTPLGPMYACATDDGICLCEFTDRRMLETEFKDLRKRLNAVILPGTNPHLEQLQAQMSEYFEGKRQTFDLQLLTPGTDFQNEVWKILQKIPYGQTASYKEQAIKLQRPEAVRAVASANGHNRVAIVIPCHRVIGSNGQLTGYAGGLARKQWLLDFERKNAGNHIDSESKKSLKHANP